MDFQLVSDYSPAGDQPRAIGETRSSICWAAAWQGASQSVLAGVTARDAMDAYMDRASATFKNQ